MAVFLHYVQVVSTIQQKHKILGTYEFSDNLNVLPQFVDRLVLENRPCIEQVLLVSGELVGVVVLVVLEAFLVPVGLHLFD